MDHSETYGSHEPVLKMLGRSVRRVLELGCGPSSTPLFLNKELYPELRELISLEHNQEWIDIVSDKIDTHGDGFNADLRWVPFCTTEPFEPYIEKHYPVLSVFDLIFIDNSNQSQVRVNTIEYMANNTIGTLAVIHDFEYPKYQEAAKFDHIMVYTSKIRSATIDGKSQTAVCWNEQEGKA